MSQKIQIIQNVTVPTVAHEYMVWTIAGQKENVDASMALKHYGLDINF